MTRRTRGTLTAKKTVTLPTALWDYLENRDIDPIRNKPRYGSLSSHLERIIREDMKRTRAIQELATEKPNPNPQEEEHSNAQ